MKKPEREIEAVIGQIIGGKSAYAVTYPNSSIGQSKHPQGTAVTFSLKDWRGDIPPQAGQVVMLSGVRKFEKGWRADSARPVLYED